MMEEQKQALEATRSWAEATPLFGVTRSRSGFADSTQTAHQDLRAELPTAGALRAQGRQVLHDV
ncbi:MAG: hypothetical protein RLZZ592_1156 [Pseudomonadota bacterium]